MIPDAIDEELSVGRVYHETSAWLVVTGYVLSSREGNAEHRVTPLQGREGLVRGCRILGDQRPNLSTGLE